MIVCHCKALTDRDVRAAALCARHERDVWRRCGAGSECGGCAAHVRMIVQSLRCHDRAAPPGDTRATAAS